MAGEPTFVPGVNPSFDVADNRAPRIQRADFGDGYSQRTRNGINHDNAKTPLRWENLTDEEAAVIWDFVTERGGDLAFYYTLPFLDELPKKWIAPEYNRTRIAPGQVSIQVSLEEVFDL